MSISAPLAVTMMIGTFERRPELAAHVDARHLGQHDVEQHEVGLDGVEDVERLGAVAGHLHAEALSLQPDGEGLDEGVLVLDDEDGWWAGHRLRLLDRLRVATASQPGASGRGRIGWTAAPVRTPRPGSAGAQGEGGALALRGTRPSTSPSWLLDHVADDGQAEAGAAGLAAAGPVDAVEALEDPLEVAGAGSRCRGPRPRSRRRRPSVPARTSIDRARVGVLHGVVEQVVDGRDELAPVAEHGEAGGRLVDLDARCPAARPRAAGAVDGLGDDQVRPAPARAPAPRRPRSG